LTMQFKSKTQLTAGQGPAGVASSAAFDATRKGGYNVVAVTSSPSVFFGINPNDGSTSWAFPGTDVDHRGPISISQNVIWSTDSAGFADIQFRTDGHLLLRYPLGAPSVGGVSFYKKTAFIAVGAPDGTVGATADPGQGALIALK